MPLSNLPWNNNTLEEAARIAAAWRKRMSATIYAASPPQASTAIHVTSELIADGVIVKAEAEQQPPQLVRLTILVFGEQIPEGKDKGRIVEMVTRPWFEIIEAIQKDPKAAYGIPPEVWEEIVAGGYKQDQWDEVILTPRSGDFGRDIIATSKTRRYGVIRIIDQVKRFTPPNLVTANDVRAMLGVLHGDRATKAIVTTTSGFAPGILTDPIVAPYIPTRLELINGEELVHKLREIADRKP